MVYVVMDRGRSAGDLGEPQMRQTGSTRGRAAGFTLIELLVVILIIGILMSILLPSLGSVRETARRLKCLTNLKGFGVAFELYRKDSKDLLPRVMPFHDPDLPSNPNDPQLFDVLRGYMDVAAPSQREIPEDPESPWVTYPPYLCPSDRLDNGPGRTTGFSYEYWAGVLMIAREIFRGDTNAQFTATKFYERNGDFAVLADANDFHPGNEGKKLKKNALYFGDWRADWLVSDPQSSVPGAPPPPPVAPPPGGP